MKELNQQPRARQKAEIPDSLSSLQPLPARRCSGDCTRVRAGWAANLQLNVFAVAMSEVVSSFHQRYARRALAQLRIISRSQEQPIHRILSRKYLDEIKSRSLGLLLKWKWLNNKFDKSPSLRRLGLRYFAKSYSLMSMKEFRGQYNPKSIVLEPSSRVRWRGPQFVSCSDLAPSVPPTIEIEQPPLEIVEIFDAIPIAASNFVLKGQCALHPDYFSAARDVCMAERFEILRVVPKRSRLYYYDWLPPIRMSEAVSLLGQCAGNYAHFLTEVLPRLLVVDQVEEYRKAPLLVDGWIHHNHLAAIRLFNKHYRNIIRVGMHQPPHLYRLIDISPVAYAPPEYRSYIEHGVVEATTAQTYKFNTTALNLLRSAALKRKRRHSSHGTRLFLNRKSLDYGNARNITNMNKILKTCRHVGFEVIETGSMTLLEQIDAFKDAQMVVAPIGAALANLIFTRPGCRVLCLSPVFEGANYYYFSNLMCALGHDLRYVLGKQTKIPGRHPFHHDYTIDMDAFYAGLKAIIHE